MGKNERRGGNQVQVQVRGADEVALVYVHIYHIKMHRKSASLYIMSRTTKDEVVPLYLCTKQFEGLVRDYERHNLLLRCFTRMDQGERLLQTRVSGSGHA